MEAEEEDEEREDTPGLPPVSAAPVRQNAGDGPELAAEGEKPALAQAEKWEWARELERSLAETPAETETKTEAPAPDGGRQSALEALGWDGPAIPVRRQNGSTVLRIPGAGDLEAAELRGANRDLLPTAGPDVHVMDAVGLEDRIGRLGPRHAPPVPLPAVAPAAGADLDLGVQGQQ